MTDGYRFAASQVSRLQAEEIARLHTERTELRERLARLAGILRGKTRYMDPAVNRSCTFRLEDMDRLIAIAEGRE